MNHIAPFSPIGNSATVAATTANTAQQLQTSESTPASPKSLRVVNESAYTALIAMGDGTVNATTDTQVMAVLPGTERIFTWKPGSTYVGVALRTGSGNVQVQLGSGV